MIIQSSHLWALRLGIADACNRSICQLARAGPIYMQPPAAHCLQPLLHVVCSHSMWTGSVLLPPPRAAAALQRAHICSSSAPPTAARATMTPPAARWELLGVGAAGAPESGTGAAASESRAAFASLAAAAAVAFWAAFTAVEALTGVMVASEPCAPGMTEAACQ